MRIHKLLIVSLALGACGKDDAPPAQTTATPPPPAVVAAPAPAPQAVAEPAAATDAVAAPTWTAPEPSPVAPDPAVEPAAEPAPAAATPPAADTVTAAPPAESPAPAPPPAVAPTVTVPADAPYKVVDGRIDTDTVEGWKIYRGIGTCATCHGPVGQGGVGPALVESLKEKITKDLFVEVVANGRDGTMMKPFGENPNVMDNIDRIYAYLKARADGVLGPENLLKYPLGKIE